MRFCRNFHISFALLILLGTAMGCDGSNNTIEQNILEPVDRTISEFDNDDIITVFPTPANMSTVYHDIDSSVIRQNDIPQTLDNHTWTVFASLKRPNPVSDPERFRPFIRLVPNGPPDDPAFIIQEEIEVEAGSWSEFGQEFLDNFYCRAVKVDTFGGDTINIVVTYECWAPGGNNWNIGITRLWWDNALEFPNPGFMQQDVDWFITSAKDERWPDIAIDQETGTGYVIFSKYSSDAPEARVDLTYRKIDSVEDQADPNNPTEWSAPYDIWDRFWDEDAAGTRHDFNSLMPRIDVGMLDRVFTYSPVTTVAVAYVASNCDISNAPGITYEVPHNGFHVHILCWDPDEHTGNVQVPSNGRGYGIFRFCMRFPGLAGDYVHPERTYYLDAGMPQLDIAPNTNSDHFGVVVFTQVMGSDNFGPECKIISADASSLWFANLMTEDEDFADGMYPSIAWHYNDNSASLTYLRQTEFTNEYHPWYARVIFPQDEPFTPQVTSSLWIGDFNEQTTLGILNLHQVQVLNPGAASAISAIGNNYWAAWCDRLQMEPAPVQVSAAWGNSL